MPTTAKLSGKSSATAASKDGKEALVIDFGLVIYWGWYTNYDGDGDADGDDDGGDDGTTMVVMRTYL